MNLDNTKEKERETNMRVLINDWDGDIHTCKITDIWYMEDRGSLAFSPTSWGDCGEFAVIRYVSKNHAQEIITELMKTGFYDLSNFKVQYSEPEDENRQLYDGDEDSDNMSHVSEFADNLLYKIMEILGILTIAVGASLFMISLISPDVSFGDSEMFISLLILAAGVVFSLPPYLRKRWESNRYEDKRGPEV